MSSYGRMTDKNRLLQRQSLDTEKTSVCCVGLCCGECVLACIHLLYVGLCTYWCSYATMCQGWRSEKSCGVGSLLPMFGFQIWDLVVRFGSKGFYWAVLQCVLFAFAFDTGSHIAKTDLKLAMYQDDFEPLPTSSQLQNCRYYRHVPPCIVECLVLPLRLLRLVPLTAQNLWVS